MACNSNQFPYCFFFSLENMQIFDDERIIFIEYFNKITQ